RVRSRSAAVARAEPATEGTSLREQDYASRRHMLLRGLRRRDDAADVRERGAIPLLHLLYGGPSGQHRVERAGEPDEEVRLADRLLFGRAASGARPTQGAVGRAAETSRGARRPSKRAHR